MKFKVTQKSRTNSSRLGCLSGAERLPDKELETPLVMLYTKGGSIPHITHEVLQLITKECQTIQIPLVSTVQFVQPIGAWDRPLADFIGLTEYVTCVTVQDPGDFTPSGKHKQDSVPIWTRSGKVDISPNKYMDMIEKFKPDMYYALSDGDTNVSSPKKRTQKSVDRTLQFFEKCSQRHIKSDILKKKMFIAAIAGGFNVIERQRCIRSLLKNENILSVSGFLIDGIHNNGPELELLNFTEVKPVLDETLKMLPEDKLRSVHGCWNPLAVINLVQMGVDVFDTSFPYIVTERSAALTFNYRPSDGEISEKFEINLRDLSYASSFEPLYAHCACLACRKHTRAYIYHLLNVQELLGTVLLTIHNLHHYLEFFKQIRDSIRTQTLDDLQEWIQRQYLEYQRSLLECKPLLESRNMETDMNDINGDTIYNNSQPNQQPN
ncbi:queuine tRNA-ribosyltransferase accessory subunit 2 [Chrysoperla carnea]|uniref:queuine tRNA-ribosyltransferase accessory subunit 2 n=1 Tax=Chrysoperla carnea TaxID=189513 RepID=UPI001D081244|nr:queuine tRNA-ribosyltransferase accessory subunit 2 [Chrysoperla carnea]